nr:MAG: hypothetical protein [Porcellio scaber clopovirus]
MEFLTNKTNYWFDCLSISLIPPLTVEREINLICRKDKNQMATKLLKNQMKNIECIMNLAMLVRGVIEKKSFSKGDFSKFLIYFENFREETDGIFRKPLCNITNNLFKKMDTTLGLSRFGEGDIYLNILLKHLDEEVKFEISDSIFFYLCNDHNFKATRGVFSTSEEAMNPTTERFKCNCLIDLNKSIYVKNCIDPESLLLLLGKYISHTDKVCSGEPNRTREFNLRNAFLEISISNSIRKSLIFLSAFCSLSLFNKVLKRPVTLSQMAQSLLLPLIQVAINKCIFYMNCSLYEYDDSTMYVDNDFDFEDLIYFMSYYNIYLLLQKTFERNQSNNRNIKNNLVKKLQEDLKNCLTDFGKAFNLDEFSHICKKVETSGEDIHVIFECITKIKSQL